MPTHRVVAGDELRSLAQRYYGDPEQWRMITVANRGVVGDADDPLAAGQELIIPISAADAMDLAAASVRPPYPDEAGATWPIRRRRPDAVTADQPDLRLRDRRIVIGLIAAVVIIALVITSVVLVRAVRQGRLEQDLRALPGIASSHVPGKVLELDPDSSPAEVRAVLATLIELRAYSGAGWLVRSGRAVLQTNVFLRPAAADVLAAAGRVDTAGVVRIDLYPVPGRDPIDRSPDQQPAVRIDILTDGPEGRPAAARAIILGLAAIGPGAPSAVNSLSVTQHQGARDWLIYGRSITDADRTARALQAVARIPEAGELSMSDGSNSLTLIGEAERDRAALCRRARDQLAGQPLVFELEVDVSDRREDC